MTKHLNAPPSRRHLLTTAPAALALGTIAAVPTSTDTELLRRCAAFREAHRRLNWLNAQPNLPSGVLDGATEAWCDALSGLSDIPATSREGVRVKAETAYLALESILRWERSGPERKREEHFALSALRDAAKGA